MNNKMFLRDILGQIDKEFPNSAMVYGTSNVEEDPIYVFVLLDDDFMYFGNQVDGTETLKMKALDVDKISKVSFSGSDLMIQMKDTTYTFAIVTETEALRALCKEFKLLKSRDATKHGGRIMDMSPDKIQLGMEGHGHTGTTMTTGEAQDLTVAEPQPLREAAKTNYVEQLTHFASLMQCEAPEPIMIAPTKEAVNEENAVKITEMQSSDVFVHEIAKPVLAGTNESNRDFLLDMLTDESRHESNELAAAEVCQPARTVEEKETQVHLNEMLERDTAAKRPLESRGVVTSKRDEATIRKQDVHLSDKEKKMLEKQRRKAEKAEMNDYKSSRLLLNIVLVVLAAVFVYVFGSYALAESGILTLPFSNLFETILDHVVTLVTMAQA